jgi:hypothetical protein
MILRKHLARCMGYGAYKALIEKLLAEGKTTGLEQLPEKVNNAGLNYQRMLRVERTVQLTEDMKGALKNVKGSYHWIVITEGWCADTAQQVPVFAAIEKENPSITLCLLLRDGNPDVMEQYLTNGTRSIPKIICVDADSLSEKFTWGPRPAELQAKVMDLKKQGADREKKALLLQKWYNADKTASLQAELIALIRAHLQK